MSSWTNERKEARMNTAYYVTDEISDRKYNMLMGAVILYGLAANFMICMVAGDVVYSINPIIFIVGYIGCCITGMLMSSRSDNPVISFIGYNLVVLPIGFVVSVTVSAYGGTGSAVVLQAFLYTALITFVMIGLASVAPEFFSKLGGILFAALLGLIICELVVFFLGIDQRITAWIGAGIFSLYIGYDFWRAQEYPKTVDNAVDSALDIYLDIINLFLRLLEILGRGNRRGRN